MRIPSARFTGVPRQLAAANISRTVVERGSRLPLSGSVACQQRAQRSTASRSPSQSATGLAHFRTWRRIVAGLCLLGTLLMSGIALHAQPSTTKVLDLDGKDAYVELPANLFTNDVVTVEGWVKWRTFGSYSRFFEFSDAAMMVGVINFAQSPDLWFQRVLTPQYAGQAGSQSPAQLVPGQWMHVAMVAGTNFSKLYIAINNNIGTCWR